MNLEPRVSCALHNSLPRAKDKKRQKIAWTRCPSYFSIPPSATKLHPPSHLSVRSVLLHFVQRSPPETRTLCKGGKKVYLFCSARFSRFIDSLKGFFVISLFNNMFVYFICKFTVKFEFFGENNK